jgi:hypothetical protein
MFSLIITIISIALVAALALATIYYGGSAFNRGSDSAKASQIINEGQQVNGAAQMALADIAAGSFTAPTGTVADLVTGNYLANLPADFNSTTNTDATLAATTYVTATVTPGVCSQINTKAGLATAPTAPTGVFGCVPGSTATANGSAFYQL